MKTIDLDKYEVLDNSTVSMECEHSKDFVSSDLTSDLLPIDTEIIDYGISEDELEEKPPIPAEPALSSTKLSSAADKSEGALVNVSRVTNSSKIKSLCIKVVDCNKYPWYYAKCQNQIYKKNIYVAVKLARSKVKSLKKNTSEPSVVIDLDELSDSSDNVNNNVKDGTFKIAAHKTASSKGQTTYEGKKHKKVSKTMKKIFSDQEMIHIKQNACNSLTSSMVDLKKNQGLIGMKVQRISENDKTKENYIKKIGKNKAKNRQPKDQHSSDIYVKAVDKIYGSYTSASTVFDGIKMNDNSYEKINQGKMSAENTQKTKNDNLKQTVTLSCDLEINSPKILMKIKRITPNTNIDGQNPEIKKKYTDARLIADHLEDTRKCSTNHQQPSNDCDKLAKYKPMPKSKKNPLDKGKNMEVRQEKLNNIKDHLNKDTEKYSMNDGKLSAGCLTKKSQEKLNESFPHENKSAEEAKKIVQIASKITNKISKTDHKRNYMKKKFVKKKKTIDQLQVSEPVKPPQAILTENVHNLSSENKPEVGPKSSTIYHFPSLEEGPVTVSKQTVSSVVQKHENDIYPNHRDIYLNKLSEYNFSVSRNERNQSSPIAYKSTSNLTSSSSHLMSQQKKEATTNQVHKRKPPEYNPAVKKTNNIDFIKSNRIYESNIQSIIPSLQECSESHENIIPNVVNRLQKLSDFYYGPVKSNDGVIQNEMSENKQTQSSIVPVQDIKSTQYNYGSMQNPDAYILGNNIKEQNTPNSVVNTSYTPRNMQESGPPMRPVAPGSTTRPNILKRPIYVIKPHYGTGFQRPPPQDVRGKVLVPDFRPFGRGSYAVRPQTSSKQVPRLRVDTFQLPNYTCTATNGNIYRMSYIPTANTTPNRNDQNNCAQPPAYNNISYQEMPYNVHMPPGICDVQPDNVHWQNNIFNHEFPLPQQPPHPPPPPQQPALPRQPPLPQQPPVSRQPLFQNRFLPPCIPPRQQSPQIQQPPPILLPPQQLSPQLLPPIYKITSTNYEKSSIIGENETGLVKKINILRPANPDSSKNVKTTNNNRGAIQKQKNTNTDANSPKYTETVNNAINNTANVDMPNSNQLIIMKELQNLIGVVTLKKPESEKVFSKELFYKQVNYEQASIPGPLSKRIKLDHELTASQNTKAASQSARNGIPKTGYSPPILPIPTFLNILSEAQTASTECVKLSPHNQSNVLTKSFKPGTTGPNSKVTKKKMIQSKQSNQIVQPEDCIKKISLEEYKKRNLKVTAREGTGGTKDII